MQTIYGISDWHTAVRKAEVVLVETRSHYAFVFCQNLSIDNNVKIFMKTQT